MGFGNSRLVERMFRCELCSPADAPPTAADEVLNLETAPETQTQAALPPASFRPLSVPSNAEQSVASKEKALGLFNMTAKRDSVRKSTVASNAASRQGSASPPLSPSQTDAITPRRRFPRIYRSDTNLTSSDVNENKDWNKVADVTAANPKGAYLLYSPGNNGSWYIQWSNKYLPDAWLFSCPKNAADIPAFKFSANRKEEICRDIHSSPSTYCLGFVLFMKEAKKYNGSLVVLKPFSDNVSERSDVFQPVVLGLHHATSTQVLPLTANSPVDAVPDVSLYDGVVAVTGHRGPVALAELAHPPDTKVPLSAFVAVGTRYGSGISFQEHV